MIHNYRGHCTVIIHVDALSERIELIFVILISFMTKLCSKVRFVYEKNSSVDTDYLKFLISF